MPEGLIIGYKKSPIWDFSQCVFAETYFLANTSFTSSAGTISSLNV